MRDGARWRQLALQEFELHFTAGLPRVGRFPRQFGACLTHEAQLHAVTCWAAFDGCLSVTVRQQTAAMAPGKRSSQRQLLARALVGSAGAPAPVVPHDCKRAQELFAQVRCGPQFQRCRAAASRRPAGLDSGAAKCELCSLRRARREPRRRRRRRRCTWRVPTARCA